MWPPTRSWRASASAAAASATAHFARVRQRCGQQRGVAAPQQPAAAIGSVDARPPAAVVRGLEPLWPFVAGPENQQSVNYVFAEWNKWSVDNTDKLREEIVVLFEILSIHELQLDRFKMVCWPCYVSNWPGFDFFMIFRITVLYFSS